MPNQPQKPIDPLQSAGGASGPAGIDPAAWARLQAARKQVDAAKPPAGSENVPLMLAPQDSLDVSPRAQEELDQQKAEAAEAEAQTQEAASAQEARQAQINSLTAQVNQALAKGDEATAQKLMQKIAGLVAEEGPTATAPGTERIDVPGNLPGMRGDAPVFFPSYIPAPMPNSPMSARDLAGVRASIPGDGNRGVVDTALSIGSQGLPYVWGGDGPQEGGYDCSGFSKAVYAKNGINIPRTAQAQYDYSRRQGTAFNDIRSAKPGDLIFFDNPYSKKTTPVGHVMVYLGNGKMVGAQSGGVKVYNYDSYWQKYTVGFARPH